MAIEDRVTCNCDQVWPLFFEQGEHSLFPPPQSACVNISQVSDFEGGG